MTQPASRLLLVRDLMGTDIRGDTLMTTQLLDQSQSENLDAVEAAVKSRLGNRVRVFHLLALGQGLILHGQTTTYHAKQLAQHAVMEATTKRILANDIVVS
jgi:hypothetical protein